MNTTLVFSFTDALNRTLCAISWLKHPNSYATRFAKEIAAILRGNTTAIFFSPMVYPACMRNCGISKC
jgi:hypothetical protein